MSTSPNEMDTERDNTRVIRQALAGLADHPHVLTRDPDDEVADMLKRWTRTSTAVD